MKDENTVIRFFQRNFLPELSKEEENKVLSYFKKETFEKKELAFTNGSQNTKHYFIESGLMRLFLIDSAGKEFNVLFARENQLIGDLVTPEPTDFNLAAVEETVAYTISEKNFEEVIEIFGLNHKSHPTSSIRRSYVNMQKRMVSILANSAEENYLEFRKYHSDLIQRLPQYHIASYLGISAEFLSKIIARNAKK